MNPTYDPNSCSSSYDEPFFTDPYYEKNDDDEEFDSNVDKEGQGNLVVYKPNDVDMFDNIEGLDVDDKDTDECKSVDSSSGKKGVKMTCHSYGREGHHKRECKHKSEWESFAAKRMTAKERVPQHFCFCGEKLRLRFVRVAKEEKGNGVLTVAGFLKLGKEVVLQLAHALIEELQALGGLVDWPSVGSGRLVDWSLLSLLVLV
ncbi:hypothetical protein Drorol1_Dr00000550 [Drosera rotundifolia]